MALADEVEKSTQTVLVVAQESDSVEEVDPRLDEPLSCLFASLLADDACLG